MEQPKVSAVITTHNRLDLLKRAINSVKSQTYNNIECIVVSDNSSDGTDEYCSSLDGIIYIPIPAKESRGGNHARNQGVLKAKGEYVAFLDDDDYWEPTKIEKQIELAEEKSCGFIYCGAKIENVIKGTIEYSNYVPSSYYSGDVSRKILTSIFTTTSEILVKRDLIIKAGMFDENLKFWQEYELSIRLAQTTEFHFIEEPLTIYRIDANDKGRLTNKYIEWKDAVKYINSKHKKLYEALDFKEMLCYKQLVWRESFTRCKNAGLKRKEHYYKFILWLSYLPIRMKRPF